MVHKIGAHFLTLLASVALLCLAVLAGLACLMVVLELTAPYLARALPGVSGTLLYTVLTAVPGFLIFRGVATRAEARHPQLRASTMRVMRVAPAVVLITLIVVRLVLESRSPWQASGVAEAFWILMVCLGALGGEVLLWTHRTPSAPASA